MLEYSAMRVIAVWPVTSTLMISKVAILCIMTRHVGEVRSPRVSLLGFDDLEDDGPVKVRGESMRGGLVNSDESDGPMMVAHRQSAVDAEAENADHHGANRWLSTFDRICLLYTSPSPRDQRGSRMPSSA